MNQVSILIRGAECAKLLPPGQWIFCWMELNDMFIVFAEQNTGQFFRGYWNELEGYWLEDNQ